MQFARSPFLPISPDQWLKIVITNPVPELSFLPAPYTGWTRAGERRVQDNLHAHAQNAAISMQFLYFPMPAFYRYNFLIMKLQLTWCMILDTEMHLEIFETCFKTSPIFTPIIPDPLLRTTFTHKALGSLFSWTRFPELEQQFGMRCLLH